MILKFILLVGLSSCKLAVDEKSAENPANKNETRISSEVQYFLPSNGQNSEWKGICDNSTDDRFITMILFADGTYNAEYGSYSDSGQYYVSQDNIAFGSRMKCFTKNENITIFSKQFSSYLRCSLEDSNSIAFFQGCNFAKFVKTSDTTNNTTPDTAKTTVVPSKKAYTASCVVDGTANGIEIKLNLTETSEKMGTFSMNKTDTGASHVWKSNIYIQLPQEGNYTFTDTQITLALNQHFNIAEDTSNSSVATCTKQGDDYTCPLSVSFGHMSENSRIPDMSCEKLLFKLKK